MDILELLKQLETKIEELMDTESSEPSKSIGEAEWGDGYISALEDISKFIEELKLKY